MFFFINLFYIIIFHIFIKIFFNFQNISFRKIFYFYLIFLLILLLFSFYFRYLTFHKLDPIIFLNLLMNILVFFCYILTIGLKSLDSPSYYIIKYLETNKTSDVKMLYNYLLEKNLLDIRFNKLIEEKMININKNNEVSLSNSGKIFTNFMRALSKLLNIKNDG